MEVFILLLIGLAGLFDWVHKYIKNTEVVEIKKWPAVLGIITFLVLLLPWPYGFYVFGKWVITPIALYYAHVVNKHPDGQGLYAVLFIGIAILFNPFYYVPLGREVWQILNVASAAYLSWFTFSKKHNEQKQGVGIEVV